MKRDFTHENFEDFLKQNADSLRMKAPEKVWKNLSKELNRRKRRIMFGLGIFLLISGAAGYYTINHIANSSASEKTVQAKPATAANQTDSNVPNTSGNFTTQKSRQTAIAPAQISANPETRIMRSSPSASVATGDLENKTGIANTLTETVTVENEFTPTIVDSYTEFDLPTQSEDLASGLKENHTSLPLSIESVINSFKSKSGKKRFESQFYFTPTISYRKLSENKSYLRNIDPSNIPIIYPALYSSVKDNVTHKPDLGFEVGFTTKYALSEKLKLRGGLQFNVNRYDVKAFSAPISTTTVTLNNGGQINPVPAVSTYSTVNNGYKTNWLQNFSFQVSAPVGAEFILSKNDVVAFGMGATVQPTYVLNDRSYMITSDYKNYTQVPWLLRRWNVNTAFETFVTYNTGKTKWQVGPQVRYQLLSSFISKYPVKENLFDFGLKVGISLNK
ncbi:MAG: hypothetical protein EON98_02540 [Chitinophagaceae bacterium]|nr:MAG: hypothetical protein EON98_02540 [Chitinophagaceae bacterium]